MRNSGRPGQDCHLRTNLLCGTVNLCLQMIRTASSLVLTLLTTLECADLPETTAPTSAGRIVITVDEVRCIFQHTTNKES